MATIDHLRGVDREVSVYGRGGAVGLVAAVTGERAYLSAVVREAGRLLVVPTEQLREFAVRNRVAHVWIELERHPEADAWLMGLGIQPQETPVVLLRSGSVARVATAAGEGSMAVRFAQEYLLARGSTTRNS